MLELAIGMTAVSLGFLLATFMGGLCIGSLLLPRTAWPNRHPLKVYAFLELGIAVCAILVHFYLPLVNRVYIAGAAHGLPGALLRAFIAAVCLLPPTILMGASLPAIVRWIKGTPNGVSWWGLLYGGNTLGAVFGCLLAGFYLLRLYNMTTAILVAAGINVAVALVSFALAARTPEQTAAPSRNRRNRRPRAVDAGSAVDPWPVYIAIALSGATALGAEVVWTRLLGYLFGLTVYCFSIILAVFLIGLAIGSSVGSMLVRTIRARLALGWTQILLTAGIAWTAWIIARSLPWWPINPLLQISPWHTFQLDMVRAIWAVLPPAILWGASFPMAVAALSAPGRDGGRVMGGVYAANTAGAIVGALATSLLLVPWIGTQQTQRVLLCAAAVSGVVVLLPYVRASRSMGMAAGLAAAVMGAAWLSSRNLARCPAN